MGAWLTELLLLPKWGRIDSGHVHRWLTKAADGPHFLWVSPRPGLLIVQTVRPLNRDTLDGVRSIHSARIDLTHPQGARLEISGIVSPTKAEFQRGRRGKIRRVPETEQADWVLRKLGPALSNIDHLTVQPMGASRGTKPDGHRLLHPRTSIHCYGTVKDPDVFTRMLTQGVGRGKRFGTGLLLAKEVSA